MILGFNIILFSITALVINLDVALYSILAFLVTAKVTDFIIRGFEDFIGLMIVSRKSEEIRSNILQDLGTGLTMYKGSSGYRPTNESEDLNIIHTVINRIDLRRMHRVIDNIDPDAFVVEYDVNNIKGGVLRRYLQSHKESKK